MAKLSRKEKRMAAIVCNAVLVALEVIAAIICSVNIGTQQFIYYTQGSNYFALVTSVIFLIYACRRDRPLPKWVILLRYMATCLLSVTFLVVIFILAPQGENGYYVLLFTGAMVFEHLICPLLSLISLLLFEETPPQKGAALLALIPTAVYAAIILPLNAARVLEGPYPFLLIYEQPWWHSLLYAIIIPLGAFMIGFFLLFFQKKRNGRMKP